MKTSFGDHLDVDVEHQVGEVAVVCPVLVGEEGKDGSHVRPLQPVDPSRSKLIKKGSPNYGLNCTHFFQNFYIY